MSNVNPESVQGAGNDNEIGDGSDDVVRDKPHTASDDEPEAVLADLNGPAEEDKNDG